MPDPKKRDDEQPPSTQPDPSVPGEEVLPDEPPPKPPEKKKDPARKSRDHDGWDEHDAAVIKNGNGPPAPPSSPTRRPTPARGLATHGAHRQVFSAMATVQLFDK